MAITNIPRASTCRGRETVLRKWVFMRDFSKHLLMRLEELNEKRKSGEIDSKHFQACLEAYKKLQTFMNLKMHACGVAIKNGEPDLTKLILGAGEGSTFSSATKDQTERWGPFLEVYSNDQLDEWLKNPKQAVPLLAVKNRRLKELLNRLKKDVEERQEAPAGGDHETG